MPCARPAAQGADLSGQTEVTYIAPAELAARYQLGPDLEKNLEAINPLTDALVAPQAHQ